MHAGILPNAESVVAALDQSYQHTTAFGQKRGASSANQLKDRRKSLRKSLVGVSVLGSIRGMKGSVRSLKGNPSGTSSVVKMAGSMAGAVGFGRPRSKSVSRVVKNVNVNTSVGAGGSAGVGIAGSPPLQGPLFNTSTVLAQPPVPPVASAAAAATSTGAPSAGAYAFVRGGLGLSSLPMMGKGKGSLGGRVGRTGTWSTNNRTPNTFNAALSPPGNARGKQLPVSKSDVLSSPAKRTRGLDSISVSHRHPYSHLRSVSKSSFTANFASVAPAPAGPTAHQTLTPGYAASADNNDKDDRSSTRSSQQRHTGNTAIVHTVGSITGGRQAHRPSDSVNSRHVPLGASSSASALSTADDRSAAPAPTFYYLCIHHRHQSFKLFPFHAQEIVQLTKCLKDLTGLEPFSEVGQTRACALWGVLRGMYKP